MTAERWSNIRIPVGVGAWLLGYNDVGKRRSEQLDTLAQFFDLRTFCPEIGIGVRVPHRPIRLVRESGRVDAVDSAAGSLDFTALLRAYAEQVIAQNTDLCGYVLVKGSPGCGMERVKRCCGDSDATGIFAAALQAAAPLLPVEEDGRLHDDALCESFVARVVTYYQWRQLCAEQITRRALLDFYARHKYLVMSRHVLTYKQLGRLLAEPEKLPLAELAAQVIELIMRALRRPATRGGHTNVLMHVGGYLKHKIGAAEKAELGELIEQYRRGVVPLIAPLALLKRHFQQHPDPYIDQQLFMQPYPETLSLRNRI